MHAYRTSTSPSAQSNYYFRFRCRNQTLQYYPYIMYRCRDLFSFRFPVRGPPRFSQQYLDAMPKSCAIYAVIPSYIPANPLDSKRLELAT